MNAIAGICLLLLTTSAPRDDEIGFVEDFALAADRDAALRQLIPGTEDYYYFHCLHLQNTRQFDQVPALLDAWRERHGEDARYREIRHRQALMTYTDGKAETLQYLRRELGLQFNHQRETSTEDSRLPSRLDPELIDRQQLRQQALSQRGNLSGFETRALGSLTTAQLTAAQRRDLLQRLERPDHPGLARLVVSDLQERGSQGFGSLPIHEKLLLSQLDECLTLLPGLLEQNAFVQIYLSKLRPSPAIDWQRDPAASRQFLTRYWTFVSRLSPAFNSLKVHILYRLLEVERSQGIWDKEHFLTYLALPRRVGYIEPRLLEREARRGAIADLGADYRASTTLERVLNDEALVRSYLEHFLEDESSTAPYQPFIDNTYLDHVFAEVKILSGQGDPERWAALLPPAKFQALKERVDILFEPTNPVWFEADSPVGLDLRIKNVETLIVKIFEINTTNFYRSQGRPLDTDINLDGLVPNQEQTFTYEDMPLRRFERHFDFPDLDAPGVYVIDFIGNGQSSRALIRKGDLSFVTEITLAGQELTVYDGDRRIVKDAVLWIDGREYGPDEDGRLVVPFTSQPNAGKKVVVTRGSFSVLETFEHHGESYDLDAGIHVDREALLSGERARVIVRPRLYLAGMPISLAVLGDVRLEIRSTSLDGIPSSTEVTDFELFEDKESVHELQVPPRLAELTFTLKARVQPIQGEKQDLSVVRSFSLNGGEQTEKVEGLYLSATDSGYVLDALGRNGEARARRPVHLTLKHQDFTRQIDVTLQSDERGRIELGSLFGIDWVRAQTSEVQRQWQLLDDTHTYPDTLHGFEGGTIAVPYMGSAKQTTRSVVSLLEVLGDTFYSDHRGAVTIEGGFLRLNELPAGDYSLKLEEQDRSIMVRIGSGVLRDGYVLGRYRQLELREQDPLQIVSIEEGAEELLVSLANSSKFARVHVFADRFHPDYRHDTDLRLGAIEPNAVYRTLARATYIEGREIGDEYQYIIDRKYAKKYPGNMLQRPSLLLNPWAVRTTETADQQAQQGGRFGAGGGAGGRRGGRSRKAGAPSSQATDDAIGLDFLANGASLLLNLQPDENGLVRIPREELGSHQSIHVVAVEPLGTAYRRVTLKEQPLETRDLRLESALDPSQPFAQQKKISVVREAEEFVLGDISNSQLQTFDTLADIYGFYVGLTQNESLQKFSFVLDWPALSAEEKRSQYSEHACHELSFFLFKKDPEFFEAVIRPYLLNKKDKTFLDDWLIEADLSGYVAPWPYSQLNTFERILLSQRLPGRKAATAREIADRVAILPTDLDAAAFLFSSAIQAGVVTGDTGYHLGRRSKNLEGLQDALKRTLGDEKANAPGAAQAPARPESKPANEAEARRLEEAEPAEELEELAANKDKDDAFFDRGLDRRGRQQQLYRAPDVTQEWAENNYWHLPLAEATADHVPVNPFWKDFAQHDWSQPFFSTSFPTASSNFTEMMIALALLDVPFAAGKHESRFEQRTMTLTAATPLIVFHEEIEPVRVPDQPSAILIREGFYRRGERYREVDGERIDNLVQGEVLAGTVYGGEIVVTNPTSRRRELKLLVQVPEGAIPVLNGLYTQSVDLELQPYRTETYDYFFYFPAPGQFAHYPARASSGGELLAAAEPFTFNVVSVLSDIDRDSWHWISQNGTNEQVLAFLDRANLYRLDLTKIAFRMRSRDFFRATIDKLEERHVYEHTLWSYGLLHDVPSDAEQYLLNADGFVAQCGPILDSALLHIRPVQRRTYQHLDYRPLINARTHQLGRQRRILNDRFHHQYHELMNILSHQAQLDDEDRMAVVYYLLLQDRIEEAITHFGRVDADALATKLQYDYFVAYLDLYTPGLQQARAIVARYEDHPVDRWRNAFSAVGAQLKEIDGDATLVIDPGDRGQTQTQLADAAPTFDFEVEAKTISIDHRNLDELEVAYYLMDIELLFSRNPFVQEFSGEFSYIRPNRADRVNVTGDASHSDLALPANLHNSNVLVEITGRGQTKSRAYYANSLTLEMSESYGQLRVLGEESGDPLSTVYVKVYARDRSGEVKFYKDGYTDRRGRFDYASLSTDDLDGVQRFAILVLSESHGATVREVGPPAR
ncbi:MAG: hypothetical protein RL885_08860 [Planctomycetota bacterium]